KNASSDQAGPQKGLPHSIEVRTPRRRSRKVSATPPPPSHTAKVHASQECDTTGSSTVISLPHALRARELQGDLTLKVEGHTVTLTHLERVYWPTEGYRKGDLLRYYFAVAPTLLPYLQRRPLILQRHPHGITGTSFYQHDVDAVPDFASTFSTPAESGKVVDY